MVSHAVDKDRSWDTPFPRRRYVLSFRHVQASLCLPRCLSLAASCLPNVLLVSVGITFFIAMSFSAVARGT